MPRGISVILRKSSGIFGTYYFRKGGSTDPKKIEAMQSWPTPTTIKDFWASVAITGSSLRVIVS